MTDSLDNVLCALPCEAESESESDDSLRSFDATQLAEYNDFRSFTVFEFDYVAIDLQRFAAEDEGRTEEPTERRKREERERGNVPRSQDLPGALVLIGGALMLLLTGGFMLDRIFQVFQLYLNKIGSIGSSFGEEEVFLILRDFFFQTGSVIFPVLAVAMVLGIVGNIVQVGFLFTMQPLELKLERMIPDFKRVLPVRRNFVNLLKVLLQVIVIGGIAYFILVDDLVPMLKASGMELRQVIGLFGSIAFKLLIAAGLFLLAVSIPDYFYQRFEYLENLKMSIADVRREVKDDVGDPLLRQRQRERAMQMRQGRKMMDEVISADVVITNPTHYAVAIRYDPLQSAAPLVVAKGEDSMALMIRRIAKENNVHIEENPPLARALYSQVTIGEEIPENFYRSIILIFQKLDRFRNMRRRA